MDVGCIGCCVETAVTARRTAEQAQVEICWCKHYLALCDGLQGPDELYPGALVWRLGNVGHALPDKGLNSLRSMPSIGFA